MAIITTNITLDGVDFTYTYSDAGYKIQQDSTGDIYDTAYDLLTNPQTYTETDIPIDDAAEDYAEAGRILLGEAE